MRELDVDCKTRKEGNLKKKNEKKKKKRKFDSGKCLSGGHVLEMKAELSLGSCSLQVGC